VTEPRLEDFPARTFDKLRYGDTDRQGHVNNAVFATFMETGRTSVFHNPEASLTRPGHSFVIARLTIDFKAEILWPGTVEIGTCVTAIGRSSVTFFQALFQDQKCVATGQSVVVQVAAETRRSALLDDAARATLTKLLAQPA